MAASREAAGLSRPGLQLKLEASEVDIRGGGSDSKPKTFGRYETGARRPKRDFVAAWAVACGDDPAELLEIFDSLPEKQSDPDPLDELAALPQQDLDDDGDGDDPNPVDLDDDPDPGDLEDDDPDLVDVDADENEAEDDVPVPPAPDRRLPWFLAAALALALIGAGAGHLLRQQRPEHAPAFPLAHTVGTDAVVRVPAAWKLVYDAPRSASLSLREPTIYTDPSGDGTGVILGFRSPTNSSLLAAGLPADRGRPRAIGPYPGVAYESPGSTSLRVFAVPTSLGVLTVACFAPLDRSAAFLGVCERIVDTLELRRGIPGEVGPSPTYAAALNDAMTTLDERRTRDRRALASARTAAAQAAGSDRLRGDFRRAAFAIERISPPFLTRAAHQRLVQRLRAVADGYGALTAAARSEDVRAYAAVSTAVERRERAASAAVRQLAQAHGYEVEA